MSPFTVLGVVIIVGLFARSIARTVAGGRTTELRDEIARIKHLLDGLAEDVQSLKGVSKRQEPAPVEEAPEAARPPPPLEAEPEMPSPVPAEAAKPEEAEGVAVAKVQKEEQQLVCNSCGAQWPAGTRLCTKCGTFLETGGKIAAVGEEKPVAAAAAVPVVKPVRSFFPEELAIACYNSKKFVLRTRFEFTGACRDEARFSIPS